MKGTAKTKNRGSPDWLLAGCVVALLALGLMMVFSSTFAMSYRNYGEAGHYFHRQLRWLGIGSVLLVLATLVDYRHLTKVSIVIMLLALGLLIALIPMGGRLLLGKSGSPVEPAKLAMIVYIAHWLASKRADQLRALPVGLLPFTIIVGIVAGLVLAQPDISEAIVIVLVAVAMFFVAGAQLIQFAVGIAGGAAALVLVVRRMPQAIERITPFLAGLRNPLLSSNYQMRTGVIALGSGGIMGVGPGNGASQFWLPAAYTDSIFAVVGEELGFLGCILVIALFALLAYRGFMLVRRTRDPFGRLLAAGITCWISVQALINLAVVTNTIPFSGIALPFISVGGSSMVMCMVGVGIMLSISREPAETEASVSETSGVGWGNGRTRLSGSLSH